MNQGELMGNDGPFTTMEVCLLRQVSGFGFRIIGGEEEGSQVQYILYKLHIHKLTKHVHHAYEQIPCSYSFLSRA